MSSAALPPQPPVDIPAHLSHGTSYVHRHYRCRCGECQSWRRDYDQARTGAPRRGGRKPEGWYVCLGKWGITHAEHEYTRKGACVRCGARKGEEDYWERKWQSWTSSSSDSASEPPSLR